MAETLYYPAVLHDPTIYASAEQALQSLGIASDEIERLIANARIYDSDVSAIWDADDDLTRGILVTPHPSGVGFALWYSMPNLLSSSFAEASEVAKQFTALGDVAIIRYVPPANTTSQ